VLFRQFVDGDLGCASYLIGDEDTGSALVVDPAFAIEPYLEEAERSGVRIERVLETHTHADHVSGHGRLALEHGCVVFVHEEAGAEFPHQPLRDGERIDLGTVRVSALHTPGHRPEHCCFAVADLDRSEEPWLVLTGDALFVGDAGRPDLAVDAREGATALFHSLRRLLGLPDGVELYPGHVAGSLCGAGMSSKASSTLGFERRFNRMLGIERLEDFVAESTAAAGVRPPNVERIVALNGGPFLAAPPPLQPVPDAGGATVLDVRPSREFAEGHLPGALNVPVDGSSFATRSAFVLPSNAPVVLHAASPEQAQLAAQRLRAIGVMVVTGWLDRPAADERLEPVALDELDRLLASGDVEIVDVREKDERDVGYIPGTRHVPYRLIRAAAASFDGTPVVTICASGTRAAVAASVLAAEGVNARPVLDGGVADWAKRGNSLVHFRRCGGQ
jgi:glyoxylase-like metal-dependent hydrolase (beta-lactamase superfamily II)/rhodanese-related sulfurtransferase